MRKVSFFTVTVDHVPSYLYEYQVMDMMAQWGFGNTVNKALNGLRDWAKENNFDGIIGLRFESKTVIDTPGVGLVRGWAEWVAYGTLVKPRSTAWIRVIAFRAAGRES
jgi:hypothetical protein